MTKYVIVESSTTRDVVVVEAENEQDALDVLMNGDYIEKITNQKSNRDIKTMEEVVAAQKPAIAMPDKTLVDASGAPLEAK